MWITLSGGCTPKELTLRTICCRKLSVTWFCSWRFYLRIDQNGGIAKKLRVAKIFAKSTSKCMKLPKLSENPPGKTTKWLDYLHMIWICRAILEEINSAIRKERMVFDWWNIFSSMRVKSTLRHIGES